MVDVMVMIKAMETLFKAETCWTCSHNFPSQSLALEMLDKKNENKEIQYMYIENTTIQMFSKAFI